MNFTTYSENETPVHPHAAVMSAQLQQVQPLLDTWMWTVYENGDLNLTMRLRDDGSSLRVWVGNDEIDVDVFVGTVPFNVHMLTWILMENFGQEFRARATETEEGRVPIFVSTRYSVKRLPELAQLIWAGYDAALGWRGRIWQYEIPQEPEGVSA